MSDLTSVNDISVNDINLEPLSGKHYWNTERVWSEEFIYFLLVDRFHDNGDRRSVNTPNRAQSSQDTAKLQKFCGGTIKGIEKYLDYMLPQIDCLNGIQRLKSGVFGLDIKLFTALE